MQKNVYSFDNKTFLVLSIWLAQVSEPLNRGGNSVSKGLKPKPTASKVEFGFLYPSNNESNAEAPTLQEIK